MKLFAAAIFAIAGLAAAQTPPPARTQVAAPDHGLRQTLEDFLRQGSSPPPRQLSAEQRAELRRQLNEYARTPARPPTNPEHR